MIYVYVVLFIIGMGAFFYTSSKEYKNIDQALWSLIIMVQFINLGYVYLVMSQTPGEVAVASAFVAFEGTLYPIVCLYAGLNALKAEYSNIVKRILYMVGFAILIMMWHETGDGGFYIRSIELVQTSFGTKLSVIPGTGRYIHSFYIISIFSIATVIIFKTLFAKKKRVTKSSIIACISVLVLEFIGCIINTVNQLDFYIMPFVYVIALWIMAITYRKNLHYDVDEIVNRMSKNSDTVHGYVHGYVAIDLNKKYLGSTLKAIELLPEVNAFSIDMQLSEIDSPLCDSLLNSIEEFKQGDKKTNYLNVNDRIIRYDVSYFSRGNNGVNVGYLIEFSDVDDLVKEEQKKQKQLADALLSAEQANIAKSTFLANMSHEIRTPINAILGMDTMILRESKEDNILEYAKSVKSAGETLLSLINDILDLSKIESGKMEIVASKYRLDSVVNDLMIMVSNKAKDKGLELILEILPQTPVQLYGDEIRIKQIILNLLNNAVKYTKAGKITFSIGADEVSDNEILLCVSVRDTGIGIKKEDMEKLFSPYERLDENVNKYIEGTGLGLSITRNLLEKMGSKLEVESIYGEGSTFSCKIRQELWGNDIMNQENVILDSYLEEEMAMTYQAPDANILVVDDVDMNIQVMVNLLKRTQIVLDQCLSGKEALELATEKKYDIIFLDAMMPEMSGEETLHAIRETCVINADTPIIVLTANAIVGAKEKYIAEGFTDYLSKPVDGIKLEKLIEHYLPADKVIEVVKESVEEEKLSPENAAILEKLEKIPMLSIDKGIEASGGRGIYIDVCRNFLDTSVDRIRMISEYFETEDIPNYTIQVHALKSSARLIGAEELSESAFAMEMAGKNNELDKIALSTPQLIEKYKKLANLLGDALCNQNDDKKTKEELTSKKFRRRMIELMELIEAYDYKTASELMNTMSNYELTEDANDLISVLKPLMADVKQDEVVTAISNYLKKD